MAVLTATPETIARAAGQIAAGGLVAFPTETVYGLGADARNGRAVAGIYAAKGRPSFNPLIVHVDSLDAATTIGVFDERARRLADRFWPGPLTMVLRARAGNGIADLVTAGLDTVAIRVPGHPIALDLIRNSGCAIAAPSANRSGHVSPTTAVHVADDLGHLGFTILDGGPCRHGLESTIVDLSGRDAMLLRQGAVTRERVAEAIGEIVHSANVADADRPTAPGQLASHYAPRAQVRLNVIDPRPGEALLAIGPDTPKHDGPSYNLSITGDLVEAAANLFAALRLLDSSGVASIAVMPIAHVALGAAINDRLRRAAVR